MATVGGQDLEWAGLYMQMRLEELPLRNLEMRGCVCR